MSKFKTLSATLIASAFVLAGCNTMSGMGEDLKRGGEKLGIGGKKDNTEHTLPSTEPATTTTDPGAIVNPNTGMPTDAESATGVHQGHGHDAATQPAESESMLDKGKRKAQEWMK